METIIFQIETELEFDSMVQVLESLEIPYTVHKNKDVIFPVNTKHNFASISIPKEYEKIFRDYYQNNNNNYIAEREEEIPPKSKTKSKIKILPIVLVIYSVLTTFVAAKYWHIAKNSSQDKNFFYQWSFNNSRLTLINKTTGKTAFVYFDENYNSCFEKSNAYSRYGHLISISYDNNEDGYYEKLESFNLEGKLTGTNFDKDNDGLSEIWEIISENKDTLRFTDINENGFYESVK